MIRCHDMIDVPFEGSCSSNAGPVTVTSCKIRCDCVDTKTALDWLSNHIHGYLRIDHDAEEGIWRCRWGGWPFLRAAGAGKTMHQAVSRCYQHAHVVRRRDREWKDEDARSRGFKDYNDMIEDAFKSL